jgi:serine/threonine protein kinase
MNKSVINDLTVNESLVLNEMNLHNRLIHENIIRAYSTHEDEENYYLVFVLLN